jgi:nitrate reductase delta subunit
MTAEGYASLACLFGYPQEKESLQQALSILTGLADPRDAITAIQPFAQFLAGTSLSEIQENYVATFDFSPALAPYLGHHLYGDHQKKATYMIKIKQEFIQHGFTPADNELPDHLATLLGFLSHLSQTGNDEVRRRFIGQALLPGLQKLIAAFAERGPSPWQSLEASVC